MSHTYSFVPDTINSVDLKGEPLHTLYHGYVKGGIGNYANALAEIHLGSLRARDLQWGADLNHFSTNGGIKNAPISKYNHQNIDLYGKKILDHHAITAGFIYDREMINKYGLNVPVPKNTEIPGNNQTYTLIGARAGIRSFINDTNAINYVVDFKYHNLKIQSTPTKEQNVLVTTTFSKFFEDDKGYFNFDIDYNTVKMDSGIVNNNLLIKPQVGVEFKGDQWNLNAGFKLAIENGTSTRFYFFPNAEFKYNVVGNIMVPYLGITGGADRNSFNSLRNTNPYISATSELRNSITSINTYLGIRGLITSDLSYNISGGFKSIKDMALFVSTDPNSVYENNYTPLYDTVKITYVSAQLNYKSAEKWSLLWRMDYNGYNPKHEVQAWNLPSFTSDITFNYNIQNKIIAKSSITFMNDRYVKTNDTSQEQLSPGVYGRKINPLFDFNIGLEYRFTNRTSAFINLNNILSQNYELWGNYHVQGFNIMAGATFALWGE